MENKKEKLLEKYGVGNVPGVVKYLLSAGATVFEIYDARFPVSSMLLGGITPDNLIIMGYSIREVFTEAKNAGLINEDFTKNILKQAEPHILISLGYPLHQLLKCGIPSKTLKNQGATARQLFVAGVSVDYLKELLSFTDLIEAGVTIPRLMEAGVTIQEMRDYGVTIEMMLNNKATPGLLYDAGFSIEEILESGFSGDYDIPAHEVFEAENFNPDYLSDFAFSAQDVLLNGYHLGEYCTSNPKRITELINLGVTIEALSVAGVCSLDIIKNAPPHELVLSEYFDLEESFWNQDLLIKLVYRHNVTLKQVCKAGAPINMVARFCKETQMLTLNIEIDKALKDAGYTISQFYDAGYSKRELLDMGWRLEDFHDGLSLSINWFADLINSLQESDIEANKNNKLMEKYSVKHLSAAGARTDMLLKLGIRPADFFNTKFNFINEKEAITAFLKTGGNPQDVRHYFNYTYSDLLRYSEHINPEFFKESLLPFFEICNRYTPKQMIDAGYESKYVRENFSQVELIDSGLDVLSIFDPVKDVKEILEHGVKPYDLYKNGVSLKIIKDAGVALRDFESNLTFDEMFKAGYSAREIVEEWPRHAEEILKDVQEPEMNFSEIDRDPLLYDLMWWNVSIDLLLRLKVDKMQIMKSRLYSFDALIKSGRFTIDELKSGGYDEAVINKHIQFPIKDAIHDNKSAEAEDFHPSKALYLYHMVFDNIVDENNGEFTLEKFARSVMECSTYETDYLPLDRFGSCAQKIHAYNYPEWSSFPFDSGTIAEAKVFLRLMVEREKQRTWLFMPAAIDAPISSLTTSINLPKGYHLSILYNQIHKNGKVTGGDVYRVDVYHNKKKIKAHQDTMIKLINRVINWV